MSLMCTASWRRRTTLYKNDRLLGLPGSCNNLSIHLFQLSRSHSKAEIRRMEEELLKFFFRILGYFLSCPILTKEMNNNKNCQGWSSSACSCWLFGSTKQTVLESALELWITGRVLTLLIVVPPDFLHVSIVGFLKQHETLKCDCDKLSSARNFANISYRNLVEIKLKTPNNIVNVLSQLASMYNPLQKDWLIGSPGSSNYIVSVLVPRSHCKAQIWRNV